MVDEERITRLASEVLSDVERLSRLAATTDLAAHPDQLDAVKYRFITAIEGCVSIAHHIVAAEAWDVPETNADAVRGLGEHDIVSEELARSLAKAAGFRNLLVHQYGEIDDKAVISFLNNNTAEIEQFVRDVLRWMSHGTPS